MASIGHKLETKGVIMTLLSLVLISTGCEERIDPPAVNPSEGKTVEVTLDLGFADETDGYTLSAPSTTKSNAAAFNYALQPAVTTKGEGTSLKPDNLYNLEIQQYDRFGNRIGGMSGVVAEQEIGSALNLDLKASSDCQLVIVAWGSGNSTTLGTGDLASAQAKSVDASVISKLIPSTQTDMNKMPYVLHLEHVCVDSNTIKSIDGEDKDVRLLLRRLATRLTLDWTYSYSGYQLKQILLQSIPLNYKVVATPDKDNKTYPSLLDQFTTVQLSSAEIDAKHYSCWIPANVRGSNSAATSQKYRIKSNAPTGSSYVDFIAANTSESKKKLSYRVYLGGSESTDFNLYGNMDYNYKVKISHTDLPVNDRRVTIIDPIPASENNSNLVPTANCFMVASGGAFCFDPFLFRQNGVDITNQTLSDWATTNGEGGIAYVKLLWQTRENGDLGEPAIGIVNSSIDHVNIVNVKRNDGSEVSASSPLTGRDQGRIYCRIAPNTMGGNGIIAAYNVKDEIIWSWHLWVTDYNPDPTGGNTILEPSTKRKLKFTWNISSDQLPMMDRNLGAMAGYISEVPKSDLDKSRTNGLQYQWGRKEPFTASYSAEAITSIPSISSDKPVKGMLNRYGPDGLSYVKEEYFSASTVRDAYKYPHKKVNDTGSGWWVSDSGRDSFWGGTANTNKTVYDPCPAGWKVAPNGSFNSFFIGQTTSMYNAPNISNSQTYRTDGGFLCYFTGNGTGEQVYIRLTGYAPPNAGYRYIGQRLAYWMSGAAHALIALINNNAISEFKTSTGSSRPDGNSIRCIQEQL